MRIALIQCPVWGTYDPPIGLAQLSGCLKAAGFETGVFDLNIGFYRQRTANYRDMWAWEWSDFWYSEENVRKFLDENYRQAQGYIEQIIRDNPRMICFSVSAASKAASLLFAGMIKQRSPDSSIVFGGPLFFEGKQVFEVMRDNSVDIVIPGEGELSLTELAHVLYEAGNIEGCKGIYHRTGNNVSYTGEREVIRNLDILPFMDLSSLAPDNYDDNEHIAIMASRGCIQTCVFCSSRAFWPGFRSMSGERIFFEVKYHIEKYKSLGHIDFHDLLFNGNMRSLVDFCGLIIKEPFPRPIKWSVNAIIRPEMTAEVLRKMARAGCEHIIYGIESGSQRVLDYMRKRYKVSDADNVLKATHDAGIMTTGNFMFGFPNESEGDFKETLDFIRRNAGNLDRVYPSRTYFAVEEYSYFSRHINEFGVKPDFPNHLYWESSDGSNVYPERLRRCEEFCALANSLGIKVGNGVQTSVEMERWDKLGRYYESRGELSKAYDYFSKYYECDPKNEVIRAKVERYRVRFENEAARTLGGNPEKREQEPEFKDAIANVNGQVRFTWNIHYSCNFRCPYCFFEGKWEEYGKRNIYLSVEEWLQRWYKVYQRYGRCFILITGGEPFTYPGFLELIKRLSGIHYPINISSNGSGDIARFIREINPRKVSLSLSLQPEFNNVDDIAGKVKMLRRHKFDGCINFVAYPPYIKDIGAYRAKFAQINEELKVIPFWGSYNGVEYPHGYTEEEKEVIGIDGNWEARVRKKGSLCRAGQKVALIFPDAKVARCGQIGEKAVLGNFLDPEFRLLEKPLPCEAENCPCDEDVPWPDEKADGGCGEIREKGACAAAVVKDDPGGAGINREAESRENACLNNDEYNAGKLSLVSSPKTFFIQAAGPCSHSCVFCSRGKDYPVFNLEEHKQRFENSLYPYLAKAECIVFTGSGEYLLLPEAGQIIDFFDRRFSHVDKCFSTGGGPLTPEIAERIVNSRSRFFIHFSLHASNSKLHKVMTRSDDFHKIIGQINYLLNLKGRRGKVEARFIFVATTLNIDDLPNFVRFARQIGADRVICYYNLIYVEAQKYLSCFFRQDDTNRRLDEAEKLGQKLGIPVDLPPRFGLEKYPVARKCSEPWSQIMFDSSGKVLPCDAFGDHNDSLLDSGFMDIWNSPRYQDLRRALVEGHNSCFNRCFRANPATVNNFASHVIHRGARADIDINWGDNF